MRGLLLLLPFVLAACTPDETISGYASRDTVWTLEAIGPAAVEFDATIQFPDEGAVLGRGPCNSFRATQSAPYPWIEIRALAATRRACPGLADEQRYFEALAAVSLAEVSDRVLLLTGENGLELVFRASD